MLFIFSPFLIWNYNKKITYFRKQPGKCWCLLIISANNGQVVVGVKISSGTD